MKSKFEYQAIDAQGDVVRGIIECSDISKAFSILLHQQLHPLELKPLTTSGIELSRLNNLKKKLQKKPAKNKIPEKEIPIKESPLKIKEDKTYQFFILGFLLIVVLIALS